MPPRTGLEMLGFAFPTRMPRRRRSRCPGWLERPQGVSHRALARVRVAFGSTAGLTARGCERSG
jgi:hypothetical protein